VIPPGVLLVRRDKISKFILWTLEPKTVMSPEMISVAILMAINKPCCLNRFATPEVAICTENNEIPALRAGNWLDGKRLVYLRDHFVQHLLVCLPLLIQPLLWDIVILHWNRQESDHWDIIG
jgi:hypothetical protein